MALQPHILHHPQVARPLHATTHPSPHGQYKWPTLSPRPLAYAQSEGECCKNRGQALGPRTVSTTQFIVQYVHAHVSSLAALLAGFCID